ncbi:MAG: sugar ABC transporter substrate-binding protein [Candidatus Cloacimonetes bacterium]|nr:sugar ABC transporter substrate-binding protein [Candidatus Cloacimonadota bacterium]
MKKFKLIHIAIALLLVVSLCMVGCQSDTGAPVDPAAGGESSSGEGASGHKVGFIQLTLGTSYHAAMSERFEALSEENGVETSMTVSQNRTSEEQLKLAEDLIAQGVEALVLNPVGDEIVPSIQQLCANANIPLICVDNTSAGSGYTYVGIDNFAIARGIGQYVGANYNGGNVVYVRSCPTDTGCPAFRFGGIMGGMSDEGEMARFPLIDERYAPSDVGEADGMAQMEEMLAANSKIDIVISHHDAQGLGALTAITNANRTDIKLITGFDGEKAFFDKMKENEGGKNGPDLVTGLNSPIMIAEITMDVLNDIFDGKSVDAEYLLPVIIISYDNVDEYYDYGF